MSDKPLKQNSELAQVLSQINTLTQHGKDQPQSADRTENIPQLNEVYEGELLAFVSPTVGHPPTLEKFVTSLTAEAKVTAAGFSDQADVLQLEKLLAEMLPLIQAIIEKNVEQSLRAKTEAEIMQTLRERLQSLSRTA